MDKSLHLSRVSACRRLNLGSSKSGIFRFVCVNLRVYFYCIVRNIVRAKNRSHFCAFKFNGKRYRNAFHQLGGASFGQFDERAREMMRKIQNLVTEEVDF